jgi:integrase
MVMDILGHSQIAVTMNTYGHVIPAMQEAAGHMDAALGDDPADQEGATGER